VCDIISFELEAISLADDKQNQIVYYVLLSISTVCVGRCSSFLNEGLCNS